MVVKRSTSIWIISGDFNTATSPIVNDVLKHTTIQPYTFCRIEKNKVKKSITDWVYFNTNRDIKSQTQSIENTLSDHVILINDFTTSVTNYPSPLLIPCKLTAYLLCMKSSMNCNDFTKFISNMNENIKSVKTY